MYIDVIKLDVNEFCCCMNLKGMRIIWSYQEQVTIMVWKHIIINPLNTGSNQDIDQFKKGMFMFSQ